MTGARVRRLALAALVAWPLVACPLGASAQPPGPLPGARPGAPRQAMQRLAQVVQRRLGLTDEQAAQLRQATGRFAAQRQQLMVRERATRRALRAATERGDSADQDAVARQLDELLQIQQRRVQIVADEQRDLARFLTPLQRAQFLALQERAFRAAQQVRQQRAQARPRAP